MSWLSIFGFRDISLGRAPTAARLMWFPGERQNSKSREPFAVDNRGLPVRLRFGNRFSLIEKYDRTGQADLERDTAAGWRRPICVRFSA
jgi:hypothetical protein